MPLSVLISTYLGGAPRVLRVVVATTVQVALLNYVLMPRVTRWLAAWLCDDATPHIEAARS